MTMSKLQLPNVTLICLTGLDYKSADHFVALQLSMKEIEFGAVNFIQLAEVKDIESWNKAMIYELPKYVHTTHAMVIHHDGYVINPEKWNPEWLELDFIGAPFPLPQDDFSYRDEEGELQRVGNSVSLRSKKLLDRVAKFPWQSFHGYSNEDGFISVNHRKELEREGFKFGTLDQAIHFSKEHEIPENVGLKTFAFHSL